MNPVKKYVCILELEMASPGNQHCADCIGTVPIVSAHFHSLQQQDKHSYQTPPLLHCCPLVGQFEHMLRCWIHAAPSLNIVSIHLSVSPISGHCLLRQCHRFCVYDCSVNLRDRLRFYIVYGIQWLQFVSCLINQWLIDGLLGGVLAWLSVCSEVQNCRLAYGPADATATHCLLLQKNPDWFYLSGTSSHG